jgi:ribonuclease P protein component
LKNFGLSKNERVKLKKDFLKIFTEGQVLYSSENKLKANYFIESSVNDFGVKAAFVVSKKTGNAVWRNRVKRLLRVAYRLNKSALIEQCDIKNKKLLVAFSPNTFNQKKNKKLNLDFIYSDFLSLVEQLKEKI